MADNCKQAGGKLLLDFHYSDTWADPKAQIKPAAWKNLPFDELEKTVETYTADTMREFSKNGATPDMVQVGNEINPGLLLPDGGLGSGKPPAPEKDHFVRLLKAGIRGVRAVSPVEKTPIMIHVAGAAEHWYFDRLKNADVDYQIIGESYYPWWHGNTKSLGESLRDAAKRYNKDVVVAEVAYNWRPDVDNKHPIWPTTPQGQLKCLQDVLAAVRSVPDGKGLGMFYWTSDSVTPPPPAGVWMHGSSALFDGSGAALPALKFAVPK